MKIIDTGNYLPPKVQTSADLSPLIGKSEKWILSRTGVAERRIAEERMDVMAAKAARIALGDDGPPDCILNASTSPLQLIPDSSVFIQQELGWNGIPSWSTHATCLSFIVAMVNAGAFLHTNVFKRILIVSSETGTPFRNFKEAESAALFGDGAAAAVLEKTPDGESSEIIDWQMGTWPEGAKLTEFRGAGTLKPPDHPDTVPEDNLFTMHGTKVYRMAVAQVRKMLTEMFDRNNLQPKDIDWVIPHQASGRGVEAYSHYVFEKLQVVNIVRNYGNCISASIPLALSIAQKEGKIKRGDLLLLGGTGAGLSISFVLLRW
ncbi:ketoacyl-ACP synthase III [candidate division KSB1 bacterium]|nr:ketoacyl-ACP synthase III [candidate division KSB1 bacterium]